MKKITLSLLGLAAILVSATLAPEVNKGLEIAKKAEAIDNGWGSSSNSLTMTLTNRNGQKTSRKNSRLHFRGSWRW